MPSELLCILDFYVLYPFLITRASMPDRIRREFRELELPLAKDQFIQIPSAKSLFRDIAVFQRTTISNLAAKGLIQRDAFLKGTAQLNITQIPSTLLNQMRQQNEHQSAFIEFLVHRFGSIELIGPRGLRALTGTRRRQQ